MTQLKLGSLSIVEALRLLEDAQIDMFNITPDTVLFLRLPSDVLIGVGQDVIAWVKTAILGFTGFDIGIVVLPYNTTVENSTLDELKQMRQDIDLTIAHLVHKKHQQKSAN